MIVRRGWGEFWGPLFLLSFHRDDPARWSKREERASWLSGNLAFPEGARVLDVGCGDGILDICLARRGFHVTGLDRLGTVLDAAREEPDGGLVRFEVADIREAAFPREAFDIVLMLDFVGLQSRSDDAALLGKAGSWLAPGGLLVLDCPCPPAEPGGESSARLEDGLLQIRWTYDPTSRLQSIVPELHTDGGEVVVLDDPYDAEKPPHSGVLRYLYPMGELSEMGASAGFDMREVEPPWRDWYYLLAGRKRGA